MLKLLTNALSSKIRNYRIARHIRKSGLFDEQFYRNQLETSEFVGDLVAHYVKIGENFGLSPNSEFSPLYYAKRYPDLLTTRDALFWHFLKFGKGEGRHGQPSRVILPNLKFEDTARDTVLLVVHEMSRTGAPILGWNILNHLRRMGKRVVVVTMGSGVLREYFQEDADYLIELSKRDDLDVDEFTIALIKKFKPLYAICNCIVTAPLAYSIEKSGVPVISLVHEFFSFAIQVPMASESLIRCSAVVFPTALVRESAFEYVPSAKLRPTYLIPQGKSVSSKHSASFGENSLLEDLRKGNDFVVLGVGTVEWRKGVDLFVAAAATAVRLAPDIRFKFIWIGSCHHHTGVEYIKFLKEQIARSGNVCQIDFFESTEHLETIYRSVDAFFLSSRLDPLPNVTIDAASIGLPVVCFQNASGFAEILESDTLCRDLVTPYADSHTAADIIVKLATNPAWKSEISLSIQTLAANTFNMNSYVSKIDSIGRELRASIAPQDMK